MTLLAYEATRSVRVEPFEIPHPRLPQPTGIKLSTRPSRWSCRSCVPDSACWRGWCGCCRAPRWGSSGCSATRRPSRPSPTPTASRTTCPVGAVLRARPDARDRRHARECRSGTWSTGAPTTVGRSPCCALPRAYQALEGPVGRGLHVPVTLVTGAIDEAAQREGLHRAGPGRCRRPAVWHHLALSACGVPVRRKKRRLPARTSRAARNRLPRSCAAALADLEAGAAAAGARPGDRPAGPADSLPVARSSFAGAHLTVKGGGRRA